MILYDHWKLNIFILLHACTYTYTIHLREIIIVHLLELVNCMHQLLSLSVVILNIRDQKTVFIDRSCDLLFEMNV